MTTLNDLYNTFVNSEDAFAQHEGIESYNSAIIPSIEIKSPKNFNCEFVYNRFTNDELTNDKGDYEIFHNVQDNAFISVNDINERIPRFIKLTWAPTTHNVHEDELDLEFRQLTSAEIQEFIINKRVNDIKQFSGGKYFGLIMRDSGIDNKLFNVVSSSFSIINAQNPSNEERAANVGEQLKDTIQSNLSIIEQARIVNNSLNNALSSHLITEGVYEPQIANIHDQNHGIQRVINSAVALFGADQTSTDYLITDDKARRNRIVDITRALRDIQFKAIVNNKYIFTVARNIAHDSIGIFSDEFSNLDFIFEKIEESALSTGPQEFELAILERSIASVENVDVSNQCQMQQQNDGGMPNSEQYKTKLRFIGYIIEKLYVDSTGKTHKYDPIVIDKTNVSFYRDREIVYNAVYHYKISTLAEFIVPFIQNGMQKFARILLKGEYASQNVKTVDIMPPKPPQDFSIYFNRERKKLHLVWAKSIDKQGDVFKYLIFKRFSFEQPFTLIGVIDFTPQQYKPPLQVKYRLDSNVHVVRSKFEQAYFFDEIDIHKSPIYALATCDAHELYSNYSIQLQVYFDTLKNKLIVKQVSNSGAPLPYPNYFVNSSLFKKAVFTNRAHQMQLFFTPDAIAITKPTEADLTGSPQRVVAFGSDEKYAMSVINTDLSVSRLVEIKIEDGRINTKQI